MSNIHPPNRQMVRCECGEWLDVGGDRIHECKPPLPKSQIWKECSCDRAYHLQCPIHWKLAPR